MHESASPGPKKNIAKNGTAGRKKGAAGAKKGAAGAKKKAAVKKEPGATLTKTSVPKSGLHALIKNAGSPNVSAASPYALDEIIQEKMKMLMEPVFIYLRAENKNTITSDHIRAAAKEKGMNNVL